LRSKHDAPQIPLILKTESLELCKYSIIYYCITKISSAMARPPSAAQRNLSLMEELEKLEQSITLTLQGTRKPRGLGRVESSQLT
jgi:hypothetical protein